MGEGVFRSLLPADVAVAECCGDLDEGGSAGLAGASPERCAEFGTGRALARSALLELGAPASPVPRGADREPVWPPGCVGSITHTLGYRAAVVAWAERVTALGIDVEPDVPLASSVASVVLTPEERCRLAGVDRTLAFSAKESVFKAWSPRHPGQWLDFSEVMILLESSDTFRAAFVRTGEEWPGRYTRCSGLVFSAVVRSPTGTSSPACW